MMEIAAARSRPRGRQADKAMAAVWEVEVAAVRLGSAVRRVRLLLRVAQMLPHRTAILAADQEETVDLTP